MANTKLTRTFGSGGSRVKWAWSGWVKRAALGVEQVIFCAYENSTNQTQCKFTSGDLLYFNDESSGNTNGRIVSNAKYLDTNAWYHLVFVWDKNNSTNTDRIKMYVNGERVTSFSDTGNWPSDTSQMNNDSLGREHEIGVKNGSNDYFDGCMSHIHFCDGYAYQASDFGSVDSVTGEWQINTAPSVSYGTTGYWILKDGNTVTDSSPNSNTWTVGGGALTKTLDNPSNNFATIMKSLGSDVIGSTVTFKYGNLDVNDPSGSASGINPNFISTLGMPSKGKWYCEVRPDSFSTSSGHSIGIFRTKGSTDDTGEGELELNTPKIRYIFADTSIYIIKYGTNDQTGLTSITSNQTVGMALDLDNGTLQYYVNGSARHNQITGINSANDGYDYFFHAGLESSSSGRYGRYYWNFGNGVFNNTVLTGTTYTDSNGQGKFQYQPPTNFLALCTKNLNI